MEEVKTKSGMSTGMIIGIAVIVAIVFGGGAYAYVNNKAEKEKKDLNAQITELQSQVSSAKTATTATPSSSTSTTATTDATANWKTYSNAKYAFSIKYPKFDSTGAVSGGGNEEWIAKEPSVGGTLATILFGPPSSAQGGYLWGLIVKSGSSTTIEKQIAGQGSQWSDRKESRSTVTLDGLSATVITVTSASNTDWISKTVYFEKDGNIYEIGNGAIASSSFDNFYKSFQFTK